MQAKNVKRVLLLGGPLAVAWIWGVTYHGIQASLEVGSHPHGPWVLESAAQPMVLLPDVAALKVERYAGYTPYWVDAGPLYKGEDAPRRAFALQLAPSVTQREVQEQSDRLAQQYFAAVAQQETEAKFTMVRYLGIALLPLLALGGLGYLLTRRRVAGGSVPVPVAG